MANIGEVIKMPHHERLDDIPNSVKVVMTFINRVGFPILAFLIMAYMCFVTLRENTKVLVEVKGTLVLLNENIGVKSERTHEEHLQILDRLRSRRREE